MTSNAPSMGSKLQRCAGSMFAGYGLLAPASFISIAAASWADAVMGERTGRSRHPIGLSVRKNEIVPGSSISSSTDESILRTMHCISACARDCPRQFCRPAEKIMRESFWACVGSIHRSGRYSSASDPKTVLFRWTVVKWAIVTDPRGMVQPSLVTNSRPQTLTDPLALTGKSRVDSLMAICRAPERPQVAGESKALSESVSRDSASI